MAKSLHTPEYEFFTSLLAQARERVGLTQSEVSARLGQPQSFVAKYEGGERRLDLIEFIQICTALGVDAQAILVQVQARVAA
jgi:transcriptional regulator with XRE-family HTH domain